MFLTVDGSLHNSNIGAGRASVMDFKGAKVKYRAEIYITKPAEKTEVLFDQLVYLIAHRMGKGCPEGCGDCIRLQQITGLLMQPFC